MNVDINCSLLTETQNYSSVDFSYCMVKIMYMYVFTLCHHLFIL